MSEQIVDLIESVMPGPMGDVTHAAIEAVGEARRYAALAQANGWAMGGDASLAMRRLDLLDTLAGVNGSAARHVDGPASEPSGELRLVNGTQITGVGLNVDGSFRTRARLSRAWRLMVQIRAPRGCRLSACWLSSDEVPDPGMLSWVSVAAGSEPHRQWVPLPAFDPSATRLVVLARPAGEEAGTLDGVSFGLSAELAEWEFVGNYPVTVSPAWDSWGSTMQHVYMALDLAPAADPNAIRGDAASLETALISAGSLVYEADWLTGAPSTSPSSASNISSVSIPLLADGAAGANLVRVDLDALTDTSLAVAWDDPDGSDTVAGLLARARVVPVKAGLNQTIDIRIPTMPDSGNPKRRLRIFLPRYASAAQVRFRVWAEAPAEATVFDLDSAPGFAAAHNNTILDAATTTWTEYAPAIRLGRVTGLAMRRTSSASPLSSASMLFLGDSWCAGSGDGTGGWATLIKATHPDATVINKGHPGADWYQAAGYHCPFGGGEPSDPLPAATDYLVVQAYTNGLYQASSEQNGVVTDGKSGLPLGTPSTDHWNGIAGLDASYPQDSHCRRADWVLGSLAREYAGKGTRLLLIAPYRAPSQDGENNAYRLLLPSIFAIARKWGYRILDNFTSSPIPYWDRTLAEPYMWHRTANDNGGEGVDDTHLGLAGNKRVTPAILTALEQL